MSYQLESAELFVREMPPDRLNFGIGKSSEGGKAKSAANRRPGAILLLRVQVKTSDGRSAVGCSGDRPSFGWLDKRPGKSPEEKLTMLLDLVENSQEIYLEKGSNFASPFALWQSAFSAVAAYGEDHDCEDLMVSYASALLERAVIDAVCRVEEKPFATMVREDRLGINAGSIHPELEGGQFGDLFPVVPGETFYIRHTVGLSDPIDDSDWTQDQRIGDGEPETLKEYAERDGLRYFKIKISGNAPADLERLGTIWNRVLVYSDQPVITLDGNEAYTDIHSFEEFVDRFEEELPGMFQHTLFIEQPLTRALTLDPSTANSVQRIGAKKPMVIDEADGTTNAFREAFAIGYSGCSHKNCKGVFKSLLNYALIDHWSREADRDIFLSGEDLSNMSLVPLHQDFAALGVLGIDNCERNGHHYAFGLSHLNEEEKRAVAEKHRDLYVERDGEYFLRIVDGQINTGSVQTGAFGTVTQPDWSSLTPLQEWREANGT
ncbi:MAG: hypothetical protein P1U81_09985 [Verrucomicrobiales bacterium]|nr:hypothetical protein [Verrucomicrobiales bacterium]